jgi:hypothetical protein
MKTQDLHQKLRIVSGFIHQKFLEEPEENVLKTAKYSISNGQGVKRTAKRLDKLIHLGFSNSGYSIMVQNIPRFAESQYGPFEKVTWEHLADSILHYCGIQVSSDIRKITRECYLFKTKDFSEAKSIVNLLNGMYINGKKMTFTWSPNFKYEENALESANANTNANANANANLRFFAYLCFFFFLASVLWFANTEENRSMLRYGFHRLHFEHGRF